MTPILEIQNISKKYRIKHYAEYHSLRERLSQVLRVEKKNNEDFWALQDISFEVERGESIGIIGRNGAGKSTLLKILSRITPPTHGRIVSRGRIASLLEVGTGFHQELSGKENIFFNGSLLGMKRKEIENKFDEIIEFSGVERFLDTPLKHYSSGMQLRLAFAVAAFLEPEILVIDEVLAVGDVEFQKKCLGKMEDVSKSGRSVLFVSHDLNAVENLCKTSILLSNGKITNRGRSSEVIMDYLAEADGMVFAETQLTPDVVLEDLSFPNGSVFSGDPLSFTIKLKKPSGDPIAMTDLCLLFYSYKKQRVAIYDLRKHFKQFTVSRQGVSFCGAIDHFNLVEGLYSIGLFYGLDTLHGDAYDIVKLQVKNKLDKYSINPYDAKYRGFVEL